MKRAITILFIVGLMCSCGSNKAQDFKTATYSSEFQTASSEKPFEKRVFNILLPKGFKANKEDFNPEYKEVVYEYKDDIKVYITDNTFGGSALNGNNKLSEGITSIKRTSLQDSIYMSGEQKNGRYWKENILNDVVVGYVNVPKERKSEFDKAIASIRREGDLKSQTLQHELMHSKNKE